MKHLAIAAVAVAAALAITTPVLADPGHAAHEAPAAAASQGTGVIKAIDAKAGSVTIQHGPIAALKWPAMTMPFKITPALLQGLKVGQKVSFSVRVANGAAEIVAIKPN